MALTVSLTELIPNHQEILRAGSQILALTNDVSKYAVKGAPSITFPTLAKRTAQEKNLNGTYDIVNINYGSEVLLLDKKIGDAFEIELHQEDQNRLNALEDNSKNVLAAMGEACDAKIYAALRAATVENFVVPTASIYDDFVELSKKLDDAFVPSQGRVAIVTSADYAKLLKTKEFTRFDATGSDSGQKSGVIGEFLGIKIVKAIILSSGQQTIVYHPNGVSTAFQGGTKLLQTVSPRSTTEEYAISEVFGVKVWKVNGPGDQTPYAVRLGADETP